MGEGTMRRLAIITAAAWLASCAGEPAQETAEAAGEAVPTTTANGSPAGDYLVSAADGTASIVTLKPDGTYTQITPEGEFPAEGRFSVVDGKTCFQDFATSTEPLCYSETAPGEDGSYIATPDGGEPLTVTRYVPEETASAE